MTTFLKNLFKKKSAYKPEVLAEGTEGGYWQNAAKPEVNGETKTEVKAETKPETGIDAKNKKPGIGSLNGLNVIGGIAQVAGNQRPEFKKPSLYRSSVRPASGNEQLVQRGMNTITEQANATTSQINTVTGSSLGANLAGRLSVQDKATKAKVDLLGKNADIQIQDQARVDAATNRDMENNVALDNQFNKETSDRQYNEFLLKNQAGNSSIQSGINYSVAKTADMENKGVQERQANVAVSLEERKAKYARDRELIRANMTPEQRKQYDIDNPIDYSDLKTNNYQKHENGGEINYEGQVPVNKIPKNRMDNKNIKRRLIFKAGGKPAGPGKPKSTTGNKPLVLDNKSPRHQIDQTLAQNYPGRDLDELDAHGAPSMPGVADTPAVAAMRRAHKPSIKVESQLPLAGKNPYKPTLADMNAVDYEKQVAGVSKKKTGGRMKYSRKS